MMDGSKGYSVRMSVKERVVAALPLQERRQPLSNLDLLLPPLGFGVFFCYKPTTGAPFADTVSTLKSSLAKTLVTFDLFAAEVVTSAAGELELLCNNRGVEFVEAHADVDLQDLHLHDPDESVETLLVPKIKDGVLCVQATELRCGGVVVACTFSHQIADAHSANMFLVSWAETARSRPISATPTTDRTLLSPRDPVTHNPSLNRLYVPMTSIPPPSPSAAPEENAVNRIYYITAADIDLIQSSATSPHQEKRASKLEAFTAYLWRAIGKGAQRMRANACSMGVVVNGRARLRGMESYFGNVLSIPYATLSVAELEGMAVGEVAAVVQQCVAGAATEEHFRGLVDWVEARRPEPAVARVYCGPGDGVGEVAVVVSSGQRFPVADVDFGWGRPAFGSYHFPWGGCAGYVMPMPSASVAGDWVVYVHLMKGLVDALEDSAAGVFRPLTADYVMG